MKLIYYLFSIVLFINLITCCMVQKFCKQNSAKSPKVLRPEPLKQDEPDLIKSYQFLENHKKIISYIESQGSKKKTTNHRIN